MTSIRRLRRFAAATALAAAAAGCASSAEPPRAAVEAYVEAVRDKDPDAVYALLDDDARMDLDEDEFAEFFEANYALILEQATLLQQEGDLVDADVRAEVPLASHRSASLAWDGERWTVDEVVPAGASQQTPRDALAAFVAALDDKDLDGLMELMSRERRGAMVGEFRSLRESIVAGLDGGLVTRGDRAVLKLNNGDKVVLVKEEGEWRIESFERGRR